MAHHEGIGSMAGAAHKVDLDAKVSKWYWEIINGIRASGKPYSVKRGKDADGSYVKLMLPDTGGKGVVVYAPPFSDDQDWTFYYGDLGSTSALDDVLPGVATVAMVVKRMLALAAKVARTGAKPTPPGGAKVATKKVTKPIAKMPAKVTKPAPAKAAAKRPAEAKPITGVKVGDKVRCRGERTWGVVVRVYARGTDLEVDYNGDVWSIFVDDLVGHRPAK